MPGCARAPQAVIRESPDVFVVVLERAFRDLPHRERGRRRPEHVGDLSHSLNICEQIRHGRMMPRPFPDAPEGTGLARRSECSGRVLSYWRLGTRWAVEPVGSAGGVDGLTAAAAARAATAALGRQQRRVLKRCAAKPAAARPVAGTAMAGATIGSLLTVPSGRGRVWGDESNRTDRRSDRDCER
jgi:hypothetical protein